MANDETHDQGSAEVYARATSSLTAAVDDARRAMLRQTAAALAGIDRTLLESARRAAIEAARATTQLPGKETAEAAQRIAQAYSAAAMTPELKQSLARLNEASTNALAPFIKAATESIPAELWESIARAAQVDISVPTSLYRNFTTDLERDVSGDPSIASILDVPVGELSPEQRMALWRTIAAWGTSFGFDITVLGHLLGEAYVIDVLRWSAALAVVQAIFFMVVIVPALQPRSS